MPTIHLRDAVPEDVAAILGLVKELAEYEKQPDAVRATEADFLRDGFGPTPRFGCRVAEVDGTVVGFALWFFNYSTWEGRAGVYIEDLYVTPAARKLGLGARLVRDVAAIAVANGARRLDLQVLDWNQPARDFYARLGLHHRDDWLPYRIEGEALQAFAAG